MALALPYDTHSHMMGKDRSRRAVELQELIYMHMMHHLTGREVMDNVCAASCASQFAHHPQTLHVSCGCTVFRRASRQKLRCCAPASISSWSACCSSSGRLHSG